MNTATEYNVQPGDPAFVLKSTSGHEMKIVTIGEKFIDDPVMGRLWAVHFERPELVWSVDMAERRPDQTVTTQDCYCPDQWLMKLDGNLNEEELEQMRRAALSEREVQSIHAKGPKP